ncbi:MAG: ribbon-helix-helix protein, CopG family [Planctomycetes bacterium]|nr:ribbon-helix-helix protein, CopG family [Planctomycetota bacterium]
MKADQTIPVNVRLNQELHTRMEEAARQRDESVSEFVREAILRHCDNVAQPSTRERLSYVIGAIKSGGGNAKSHKEEFAQALLEKHARRKRK